MVGLLRGLCAQLKACNSSLRAAISNHGPDSVDVGLTVGLVLMRVAPKSEALRVGTLPPAKASTRLSQPDAPLGGLALCMFLACGFEVAKSQFGAAVAAAAKQQWKSSGAPTAAKVVKALDKFTKVRGRHMTRSVAGLYASLKLAALVSGLMSSPSTRAILGLNECLLGSGWMTPTAAAAPPAGGDEGKTAMLPKEALKNEWSACASATDASLPFCLAAREIILGVAARAGSGIRADSSGAEADAQLRQAATHSLIYGGNGVPALPSVSKLGASHWCDTTTTRAAAASKRGLSSAAGMAQVLGLPPVLVSLAIKSLLENEDEQASSAKLMESVSAHFVCSGAAAAIKQAAELHVIGIDTLAADDIDDAGLVAKQMKMSSAAGSVRAQRSWRRESGAASLHGEGKEDEDGLATDGSRTAGILGSGDTAARGELHGVTGSPSMESEAAGVGESKTGDGDADQGGLGSASAAAAVALVDAVQDSTAEASAPR